MTERLEPALPLKIRRTGSLASLVRRELERMIETGELKAGDWLNENALAARLGVSRGPVREACRGLEQSGIFEVVVNRGVFVRELQPKEAAELYDIRAALMRLLGQTLAPRITIGELGKLASATEKMDKAARAEDLNAFYALNLGFHGAMLDFAGNERLSALHAGVQREMHLFRRRTLDMPGRLIASNEEHRRIVAALATRHAETAAREMEEHVLISKNLLFGPPAAAKRRAHA